MAKILILKVSLEKKFTQIISLKNTNIYIIISKNVCLSVYLSICLSVCLFVRLKTQLLDMIQTQDRIIRTSRTWGCATWTKFFRKVTSGRITEVKIYATNAFLRQNFIIYFCRSFWTKNFFGYFIKYWFESF